MRLPEILHSTPFRIGAAYAAIFSVSAAALFGVLFWSVTSQMTRELQVSIEQDVRSLTESYAEGRLPQLMQEVGERWRAARPGEVVFLLQGPDAQVLGGNTGRTAPFVGWRKLTLPHPPPDDDGDPDPDEASEFLVLGVDLGGPFLMAGRNLHRVADIRELFLQSLAWTLAVTIALALAGGAMIGRSATGRIEAINRTARAIIGGDLSQRISARYSNDELGRLVGNINHMLDRIEELMEGLRQVTNDIAHDMRTPLGRLRQRLETARRRETTLEGHKAVLDRAIAETDTILDTFGALLRIAQIEARTLRAQFAEVDLSDVATTVAEAYASVAEDAGQGFRSTITPDVHIFGDKDLLTQMTANLVENAIRHCPRGSVIALDLNCGAAGPILGVADNGRGIPADMRDKVVQRFYRLEDSRTTPGSGLGLALAKAVADLHGAAFVLSDNAPGLRVEARFPAQQD